MRSIIIGAALFCAIGCNKPAPSQPYKPPVEKAPAYEPEKEIDGITYRFRFVCGINEKNDCMSEPLLAVMKELCATRGWKLEDQKPAITQEQHSSASKFIIYDFRVSWNKKQFYGKIERWFELVMPEAILMDQERTLREILAFYPQANGQNRWYMITQWRKQHVAPD